MIHYHSINIVYIPSNTLFWSILKANKLIVGSSKAFVKGKGISLEGHKHSAGDITSGTLPVARGGTGVTSLDALKTALGVGGGTSGMSYNVSNLAVGKIVWFNYDKWRCVHIANGLCYLIKYAIDENTVFGSNTTYAGSTAAAKCLEFQNQMAADSLALCQNWTVNGVTQKVNLISYEQANGGFAYFKDNASRIAYMGTATYWWTSSPNSSSDVWGVNTDGSLDNYGYPSDTYGFRPCVAIKV